MHGRYLAGAAIIMAATLQTNALDLYVSPTGDDAATGRTPDAPLATPAGARDAIRAARAAGEEVGPVTVYLRGGVHALSGPLELGPEDSGTAEAPVTWTAFPGERPVLDGGRRVTGWQPHRDGIWVAPIPEARDGGMDFRQVYVNGDLRRRARIPNEGFLRVAGCPEGTPKTANYHKDCQSFEYAPGDIDPGWTNLQDVEVIVYHFWTDSHLPIRSVDPETRTVTFKHKAGKVFTDDFSENGARYIVENVFEGLDAPGEWYLDRREGALYMIPMPGEDLAAAEVVVPVAPALVRLTGDAVARRPVEHIRFSGLALRHTNFVLPEGNSNDRQGSAGVPAAVVLRGARNCRFEHCELTNLGTFAVDLLDGCRGNELIGNRISRVAAGGFRLNGGTERDHPLRRTGYNVIEDNELQYYGETYPSAVGVLLMNTEGNRVAHNHIHHGWYTGVSVGWVWGYQRSVSRDNVIAKNHIHHIGQGLLSDMGAIYTLGVSPGTVIRGNVIHDVDANHYGGWGIYNDEGSSHLLIEDNVVYNTKFAGYNIHFAKEVTVRNNIFAFGRLQQLSRSRMEPHKSVFFENNIVVWREGALLAGNWKDEPYTFHFHPKDARGTRETNETFDMDHNLYFNPDAAVGEADFHGKTFEQWREAGKDAHSLYADPKFRDPENGDFTLADDSPAWGLGFRPIRTDDVGPTIEPGIPE